MLGCADVERSIAFYERLGFTTIFRDQVRGPRYAAVRREGVELHLQWHEAPAPHPAADRPVYRLVVSDADAVYREFLGRGALAGQEVHQSPWASPGDTPWGTREFHLRDPDGNGLQFYRAR